MRKDKKEVKETGSKNPLYPVFLKLEALELLLVGAGNVGLEKLQSLLGNAPQARITVVAPRVLDEVRALLADHPACILKEREFVEADLEHKDILILATDNPVLHREVKQLANAKGILVNVADTPELCDFYLGSIVQKGNLKIAISTNGKSPTAGKRIKEVLQEAMPGELDQVIDNLHILRGRLNGNFHHKVKKLNQLRMLM